MRTAISIVLLLICGCSSPKTEINKPKAEIEYRLLENITNQDSNTKAPQIIFRPLIPKYPEFAKAAGIEGLVKVEAIVTEDGYPSDIRAISGPPALRNEAQLQAAKYRFTPAIVNGIPTKSIVTLKFFYKIKQ